MSDVTEAPTQDAIAESLLGEPEPQMLNSPKPSSKSRSRFRSNPLSKNSSRNKSRK